MFKNEAVALGVLEDFRSGLISRRQVAEFLGCSERELSFDAQGSSGNKGLRASSTATTRDRLGIVYTKASATRCLSWPENSIMISTS